MKTKFYWLALPVSAAMIAQANAGGHPGGGGFGGGFAGGGGHFSAAPARGGSGSSFHPVPMRSFGGSRMIYSSQRFSPMGMHSPVLRQPYATRQVTTANINRRDRSTRFSNGRNHVVTNPRREGIGASQIRHGNNFPANWRNHVVAQHSANWHRDWDRGRDHWWHGHHCRFIDGSWVIFDSGFYPWWPYWYPDDYYGYNYYGDPYGYDSGSYDSGVYEGNEYYGQNGDTSSDQYTDSTVVAAQEQLARQHYYHGEIDGIIGPETRRAIGQYQRDHDLRVTGYLTSDTLRALGLQRAANY